MRWLQGLVDYASWLGGVSPWYYIAFSVLAFWMVTTFYGAVALFVRSAGPSMEYGILAQVERGVMELPIAWSYPGRRKDYAKIQYMAWSDAGIEYRRVKIDELLPRQEGYSEDDVRALSRALEVSVRNELISCATMNQLHQLVEHINKTLQEAATRRAAEERAHQQRYE